MYGPVRTDAKQVAAPTPSAEPLWDPGANYPRGPDYALVVSPSTPDYQGEPDYQKHGRRWFRYLPRKNALSGSIVVGIFTKKTSNSRKLLNPKPSVMCSVITLKHRHPIGS